MQKLVWKNSLGDEIDLTSGHYGITEWEGFSGTELNIQSQQVPFQDGSVFLDALLSERELSVTLAMEDENNLETRYQLRRELIHILNPKLGEGYLIYTNDFISKRIKCVPHIPLFPTKNSNDPGTPKASLAWTACEPYWEDLEKTVISMDETDLMTIDNKGDVPIGVEIEFETVKVENPKITNLTNKKYIEYDGETANPIFIDTRTGSKQLLKQEYSYILDNTSGEWVCADYVPFLDMLFFSYAYVGLLTGNDINNLKINFLPKDISGITHNDNIVVAVGQNGIYSSNNGIDWELRSQDAFDLVIYSKEKNYFIAISHNGEIYKSTDGISWIEKVSIEIRFESITYFNNFFWLGCDEGLYKYDGETTATQILTDFVTDTTTDRNTLIVLCSNNVIKQSEDGVNFVTINGNLNSASKIIYNDVLHLYYAYSYSHIYESMDLLDWTEIYETESSIMSLVYIPELLYTYMLGNKLGESIDLKSWNFHNTFTLDASDMKYAFNKLIFCCTNYLAIKKGNHWTTALERQNAFYKKIINFPNSSRLLVADKDSLYASTDGENWNQLNITLSVTYMATDNNCIVIIEGVETLVKTIDGETFSRKVTILNLSNAKIIGGENYFLLKTSDNKIYKVNEDLTTELVYDFESNYISSISYHKKLKTFVALVNYTNIYISKNGTNWKKVAENIQGQQLYYEPILAIMFVCGVSEYYSESYDLYTWEKRHINLNIAIYNVTYDNDNNEIYLCSPSNVLHETTVSGINEINKLTNTSDMGFNLEVGDNLLRLNKEDGNFRARIIFRQKYIGV